LRSRSIEADLKLITSMKNVINWKTMSRIGVKLGSALAAWDIEPDMVDRSCGEGQAVSGEGE
jgi:hypothetical protein